MNKPTTYTDRLALLE